MKPASPATETNSALGGKYLTVVLDNESYGISVLRVREIIRLQKITPVPQLPDYVKGVINLRGRVIPVIDLRMKFGLKAEVTERTCVVVTQVQVAADRALQMGLIVDSVEEVANILPADIEPTPEFGCQLDTRYLIGMAKIKGQVKTLLDIDRVVAPDTLQELGAVVA